MWKYLGDENGYPYVQGVPARDLSDEEFEALPEDRQEDVRGSSLYEYEEDD